MFKWLRNRIELLKNDKQLALIMLLYIVLISLHVCETTEELMAKYVKEKKQ